MQVKNRKQYDFVCIATMKKIGDNIHSQKYEEKVNYVCSNWGENNKGILQNSLRSFKN